MKIKGYASLGWTKSDMLKRIKESVRETFLQKKQCRILGEELPDKKVVIEIRIERVEDNKSEHVKRTYPDVECNRCHDWQSSKWKKCRNCGKTISALQKRRSL